MNVKLEDAEAAVRARIGDYYDNPAGFDSIEDVDTKEEYSDAAVDTFRTYLNEVTNQKNLNHE